MQTKHLITFLSAAKEKSLSKASMKLNYAPSTIYEHVAALEKELDAELYSHNSRELELTPEGKLLADYADRILTLWDNCRMEINGKYKEQIRICASETLSKYYIYGLLRKFMKKRPQTSIDLKLVPGAIAVERLRSYECDVAFSFGIEPPFADIEAVKLFSAKMIFVAHPSHSFVRCQETPRTILREALISNLDVDYVKKIIRNAGIDFDTFFSSYLRAGGLDLVKSFPLGNDGIAFLPEVALQDEITSGSLAAVTMLGCGVVQDAYALTPAKRDVPSHVQELLGMAANHFGK